MYSAVLAIALAGLTMVNAQAPGAPVPIPGVTGQLGDATVVDDNEAGVTYTAFLPNRTTSDLRGFIAGTSNANGTGVNFAISVSGFPDPSLGPFMYHIHDQPVPSNGNCTATLAHLDPYIRGEQPPCDPTHPETCQSGDLSGKHGNVTGDPFNTAYLDLYLSTHEGPASFFGNRSIVFHTSNATRLTCANFTLTSGDSTASNGTPPGPGGNGTVNGSTPPTPFEGRATTAFVSAGAIVAGLAALLL